MAAVFSLLSGLSFLISLYTLICFARIIITWFPQARNSRPGVILGRICDPYLELFRGFSLFRQGSLDFTPVIAIGVLVILSSICANIAAAGRISLGIVTGTVIGMIWSTAAAFLNLILLIMVIRLIFDLIHQDSSSGFWAASDAFLNPLIFRLTSFFFRSRYRSYRTSLITAIGVLLLIRIAGELAAGFIAGLLFSLPV